MNPVVVDEQQHATNQINHHVPVSFARSSNIQTMTPVDPTTRYVDPRGFGFAILVVNLVFLALAVVCVGVRACVRILDRKFCVDDGFMAAGTLAYAGQIGLSSWSCFTGLGAPDSRHNELMLSETKKIYIVWVIVYNLALALVKSAICLTMIRIFAYQAKYVRASALTLIGITWAAFVIALVGILVGCQPISANWSNTSGKCSSKLTYAAVTYFITATALFTDLAIVVLNISVIWRTMMPRSSKIQVFSFMSFASLASIFSIIRTVFLTTLSDITTLDTSNQGQVNAAVWLGYIVIFSNLENGAGCILSSLPAIRRLIGRTPSGSSADVAVDTSTSDRRVSDRRISKPVMRVPRYDDLTTVDLHTINDDHPKSDTVEQNIAGPVEDDMINRASSSNYLDPCSCQLGSSQPLWNHIF